MKKEKPVYIIAEAGVNHNGSLKIAKKLVDCAKEAGADAVKFQTFKAENVATKKAPLADYQKKTTRTHKNQRQMIKTLELGEYAHRKLADHCARRGIEFLSTPFDEESVDLLTEKLKVKRLKIPSGEITNAPLILKMAGTGLPLFISTGMATLEEVRNALQVVAFGWLKSSQEPSLKNFIAAYKNPLIKQRLESRVTLLHCTTAYPTPFCDVNLLAMDSLKETFGLPVGLSDHTPGIVVSIAAAARGARVLEKHFTLNRRMPGPDHSSSLEPKELRLLVLSVRQLEEALGNGLKAPRPSEMKNRLIARRSLVAAKNISAGEIFSEENLSCKRPATGLSPFHYWEWLGKKSPKNFRVDEEVRA